MNIKNFTISLAAALLAMPIFAQEAPKAPEYEFTTVKENPITSF